MSREKEKNGTPDQAGRGDRLEIVEVMKEIGADV
jgi:hypothetical protein